MNNLTENYKNIFCEIIQSVPTYKIEVKLISQVGTKLQIQKQPPEILLTTKIHDAHDLLLGYD